jgi:carbonic anhydrase/acetyltransferase-like protein (isoleucine patch superfamily)
MNAVLMDDVVLGEGCIVGALCFLKAGEIIPARSLVVGNPGKIIKEVSDEMLAWKTEGTRLYQQLPEQCYDTLRPCEPLRVVPKNKPEMPVDYAVWKKK